MTFEKTHKLLSEIGQYKGWVFSVVSKPDTLTLVGTALTDSGFKATRMLEIDPMQYTTVAALRKHLRGQISTWSLQ